MENHSKVRFENSYNSLPESFFKRVNPEKMPDVGLFLVNQKPGEKETEKNLNSTLLLEPDNEEAMYMIIDIELKRSNFSKVKELQADFEKICTSLCEKITSINERLKNFDTSNES